MRRTMPSALAAACLLTATAAVLAPSEAVTNGSPDAGAHPMVAHMVAQTDDGDPLWRCSGTLLDESTVVTAGHCTSDDGGGASSVDFVALWFGNGPYVPTAEFLADVREGDDPSCLDDEGARHQGYPCTGERTGEAFTHPDFDPAAFTLHDLGVVVLDEPLPLAEYGELPAVGAFDSWGSNRKQVFTAVGYGKQEDYGQGASWKDVSVVERRTANPELIAVNTPSVGDYAMRLTNNAKTGGTCSGDSGGPNFLGDSTVIAGVTSSGVSMQTCGGNGGIYRLDREEDIAFLEQFALR